MLCGHNQYLNYAPNTLHEAHGGGCPKCLCRLSLLLGVSPFLLESQHVQLTALVLICILWSVRPVVMCLSPTFLLLPYSFSLLIITPSLSLSLPPHPLLQVFLTTVFLATVHVPT